MTKEYIWYQPDGDIGGRGDLKALRQAAAERIDPGRKYILSVDGEPIGNPVARATVLDHLERRAAHSDVGHTFRVKPEGKPACFKFRVVEPLHVPVEPVNGNVKANAFWQALNDSLGSTISHEAGSYVCKPDSQHRYGNALDVFFKSFAEQERAAAWAVAHADELDIEHVISGDRIWTRGVGWHAYTGEYHAHLHVDFMPNFNQSLPCGIRN